MMSKLFIFAAALMLSLSACGSTPARYNNQGNSHFEQAEYEDALEEYSAAKEVNPELAEPFYNSGNAYHNKGDFKSAIDQTQRALRLAKENDALAEQAFFNLGNSYYLTEDWAAALKAYQEALLLDPHDQEAKYNLELTLRNIQRQQQGQQGQQPNPDGQPGGQGPQGQQPQNQPGGEQQPGGGGEGEEEETPGGNKPEGEEPGGAGGELSKEEAEQLLDDLSQNSQTLQERLNQPLGGPGYGSGGQNKRLPPAQDW